MIDKSVIIVGNGSILKSQGLGHKIDQFDEVIRINDWKTKGFEEIAGSKTTIWVMYNPIKCGKRFIEGYNSLGFDIDKAREIVSGINEIWYICWKGENLLDGWKYNEYVKELNVYDKIKRHLSIPVSKKIRRVTDPPSTGFSLIWILTHMYDKIYIAGFDFGGVIHTEGNHNHYFGNKTKEYVSIHNVHNMKFEYEYINRLIGENKIEVLTRDSIINGGKFIGKCGLVGNCEKCKSSFSLYDWEQHICNYCERRL